MAAHRKSLDQVSTYQQDDSFNSRSHHVNLIEVVEEKGPFNNGKLPEKSHEEEAETGRVKWSVYSTFVTSAYGGALVPVILLCQVLFQGLQMGSNYWMAWATEKEGRVSRERLIWVFVMLSGGSSIFILGRAVFLATIAIQTAQNLFLGMITSVFRAPISFFDSTPSSRILNRVSSINFFLQVNRFCFVDVKFFKKMIAVFYGSKHCRHGHSLQISWISICTYPTNKHHSPYVSSGLASFPSFPSSPCTLHMVSSKKRTHFEIIFSLFKTSTVITLILPTSKITVNVPSS